MAAGEWRGDQFRFGVPYGGRGEGVSFESKSKQDCLRRRQVISELLKNKEKEKERLKHAESDRDRDRNRDPDRNRDRVGGGRDCFGASTSSSKPTPRSLKPVRPISKAKQQTVQKLKDARDYTFLFSDGGGAAATPTAKKNSTAAAAAATSNRNSVHDVRAKASDERRFPSDSRKIPQDRKPPPERKMAEVKPGKLAQEILKTNSLKPPVILGGSTPTAAASRPVTTPSTSKPAAKASSKPSRPPVKMSSMEAKKLKEARDYSFLFGDNDDSAARNERRTGGKEMPPRSTEKKVVSSSTKPSSRPVQAQSKAPSKPATTPGKPSISAKPVPKPSDKRALPDKRPLSDTRKPLPEKRPMPQQQGAKRKFDSDSGPSRQNKPLANRPPPSKPQQKPAIARKPVDDWRRDRSSSPDSFIDDGGLVRLPKQFRLRRAYDDDDGYDSSDSSNMVAGFNDIQLEERRSARIAREEDEEQLKLIEEEERQERLRKKKRKL